MIDKTLPLTDITPYDRNPRKNDQAVQAVAQSIQDYGFASPIIVDKDHVIIAGHTRYKAAQLLGLDKVPVRVADELTKKQADELRLVDNRVGELAEWDIPLLNDLLTDLPDAAEYFLDFPELDPPEIERIDLSDTYTPRHGLEIETNNETETKQLFEEMTNRGYQCKPL